MNILAPSKYKAIFFHFLNNWNTKKIPAIIIGRRVRAAKAKNIPDQKCFCLKCRIKEVFMKKMATTCAKNHVVPTTEDQKKGVPNPKNNDKRIEFLLEVKFKRKK